MTVIDELQEIYDKIETNIEKDIDKLQILYCEVNERLQYYENVEEYLNENKSYQIDCILERIDIIKRIEMNIQYNPERFKEQERRYKNLHQLCFEEENFKKLFEP